MTGVTLRVRAWLALLLLVAFPILAIMVLGMLFAAAIWMALALPVHQVGGVLLVALLPLVWPVLKGVRHALWQKRPPATEGFAMTRSAQPAFWQEVDALTRAMRQPPVERITVVAEVNAAVSERAGHRELIVGLPLLGALSRGQLRAVLAHEMGHFASGHTRASLRTYRASAGLHATAAAMHSPLGRRAVGAYLDLYDRIAMPVLRDHEYRADQWSAALAGGRTAAASLVAVTRIDVAWSVLAQEYLPAVAGLTRTPSAIEGLRHVLAGPLRDEILRVADERIKAPGNAYDTHPLISLRIVRLVQASGPTHDVNDQPALNLLARADAKPIEQALGLGSGHASWDDAVTEKKLQQAAEGSARIMSRLLELQPSTNATVRGLLDAVATGRGPALVSPYLRGDIPSEHRSGASSWLLSGALQDAVLDLLSEQGLVQIQAGWEGQPATLRLKHTDGSWHDWPESDFRTAADSDSRLGTSDATVSLRRLLTATAADLDRTRTAAPGRAPESIPVAALTVVIPRPRFPEQHRDQAYDLVAYDDGLLLAFVPERDRGIAAGARHTLGAGNGRQLRRVERLIEQVGGKPAGYAAQAGKGARWIPYPAVAHAYWLKSRMSTKWQLSLQNAQTVEFTPTAFSEPIGDIQETVANAVY